MNSTVTQYTIGAVTSADGTTISFRQLGSGPGLIILSGGYLSAQYYMELATALADAFTVYVPDRRGRGLSGPQGEAYCMARECEDVAALQTETAAHFVFGHSSGGLIALQAALNLPALQKVAVFEPSLSMYGSFDMSWIPRFEREIDQGKLASAIVTFSKGVRADRVVDLLPRWLLVPMLTMYFRRQEKMVKPGEESVATLLPLQRFDVQLFQETASSAGFADLPADLLLMEGAKTPPPVRHALDALQKSLPHAQRVTFPGVGHEAPIDSRGVPDRVAGALRAFFLQSS